MCNGSEVIATQCCYDVTVAVVAATTSAAAEYSETESAGARVAEGLAPWWGTGRSPCELI